MIESLWSTWVTRVAADVPDDQLARCTRAFTGYCCRLVSRTALTREIRAAGLLATFMELRAHVDGHQYSGSRFWRAVWAVARGATIEQAVQRYCVLATDVEWALGGLSARQYRRLQACSNTPWVREPRYDDIAATIETMRPYCTRYIHARMRFMFRYDSGLEASSLIEDFLVQARGTVFRYDGRVHDLVHLRNLAWRSACRWAASTVTRYSRTGQARVQRVGTEQTVTRVTVSRTAVCRACGIKSSTPVCRTCRPAAASLPRDTVQAFVARASSETRVIVKPRDIFARSTVLLGDVGGRDRDGRSTEYDIPDHRAVAAVDTVDMLGRLRQQSEPVQRVCRIVMGDHVPEFDGWLAGRTIADDRLAAEACRYAGITLADMRSALAPVLGVQA